MKYESKIIEAAIASMGEDAQVETPQDCATSPTPLVGEVTPAIDPCDCPKPMSYRELTKGAREIMRLNGFNLKTVLEQQGFKGYPKISSCKFIEFRFGNNELIGVFRATFLRPEHEDMEEGTLFAGWNGNKLRVW